MRKQMADVHTFCLFIGHARSGHSIIGALLDAHPQIVISDELDALRYVEAGFRPSQILYLPIFVAKNQAERARTKAGLSGATYSYAVTGQWQGRYESLQVIGDSTAGMTVQRLARDRSLLARTRLRLMGRKLRFIHVTRNPFDNIATMMMRGGRTFENAADRYFSNCEAIVELAGRIAEDDILQVRHEDVILTPQATLERACGFLGVPVPAGYLDACAGILFPQPSRTRAKVEWSQDQRGFVERRIAEFPFLAGYSFTS
ncbi:MAG: sulfotransferase [Candidatus Limnocylindria bacterium]